MKSQLWSIFRLVCLLAVVLGCKCRFILLLLHTDLAFFLLRAVRFCAHKCFASKCNHVSVNRFGIGGGIVQGPLMLAMGVHPAVASATSACMILFTSFTATTTYAVHGILVHDYAVVCTVLGFMSTAVGQLVMSNLLKKTNRNSYIAFSIGIVILLSALLMTLQTVMNDLMYNMNEKSSGICGHM